jgi:group I intron endonuclease
MDTNAPYTYHLFCIPTQQHYYGVRWGNKVSPEKDLWLKYFSSCKKIKKLVKEHGKENFVFEIRKIFEHESREDAIVLAREWEERVLLRLNVLNRSDWLNNCIGKAIYNETSPLKGKPKSEETKRKLSEAKKGKPGKPHSEEHKQKQSKAKKKYWDEHPEAREAKSEAMTGEKHPCWGKRGKATPHYGKPHSKESKQKMANSHSKKTYRATDPSGNIYIFKNMRGFCRVHRLHNGTMYDVANGKLKQHKGWSVEIISEG